MHGTVSEPPRERSPRRVLVTGAGGFIGHRLVTALKARGLWVRGVGVTFPAFAASPADDYRLIDLTDWHGCLEATRGIDDVFALAATAPGAAVADAAALHDDIVVSSNTAMAASENHVERIVVAATHTGADEQERTSNVCSAPAELVQELAWRWRSACPTHVCVVRLPHVFGELDAWKDRAEPAVAALCRRLALAAIAGETRIEIRIDRHRRRSYLYVEGCVQALLEAMWASSAPPVLVVPGEVACQGDVVDELARLAGVEVATVPRAGTRRAAAPTEPAVPDAVALTGWNPKVSLSEGLSRTYCWVESQTQRHAVADEVLLPGLESKSKQLGLRGRSVIWECNAQRPRSCPVPGGSAAAGRRRRPAAGRSAGLRAPDPEHTRVAVDSARRDGPTHPPAPSSRDEPKAFAYVVYVDGAPGEEGYVVLTEPLRDHVITRVCRCDDGGESIVVVTHVQAHPENGRPGVAAATPLDG